MMLMSVSGNENNKNKKLQKSLSNLADNLAEGIHKRKCKHGHNNEKCKTFGITYKYYECCLEYTNNIQIFMLQ